MLVCYDVGGRSRNVIVECYLDSVSAAVYVLRCSGIQPMASSTICVGGIPGDDCNTR